MEVGHPVHRNAVNSGVQPLTSISENVPRTRTRQPVKVVKGPPGAEIAFVFKVKIFRMSGLSKKLNSDLKSNFKLSHSCG